MDLSIPSDATIRLEDLQVIAQLGLLRHATADAEARRTQAMRAVADAAAELTRALGSHTRSFLVNCQGSHGASDLERETVQLHAALAQYAAIVQHTVRERRQIDGSEIAEGRRTAGAREAKTASSSSTAPLRRAV
jgi:hypothetical protein